jgi:hypothetical protein
MPTSKTTSKATTTKPLQSERRPLLAAGRPLQSGVPDVNTSLPHAEEQRIEDFGCVVRRATRWTLLDTGGVYLDQMDQAKAQGVRAALEWARARRNGDWDELDARSGTPNEVCP